MWLLNDNRLKIIQTYGAAITHLAAFFVKVDICHWKPIEYMYAVVVCLSTECRKEVSIRNARNAYAILFRIPIVRIKQHMSVWLKCVFAFERIRSFHGKSLWILCVWWKLCLSEKHTAFVTIRTERAEISFSVIEMFCALFSVSTTSDILWVNAFALCCMFRFISFH